MMTEKTKNEKTKTEKKDSKKKNKKTQAEKSAKIVAETDKTENCKPNEPKEPNEAENKIDSLEKAMADAKKFQDLYLRKAADFENYRKRMIKEKQDAITYANSRLLSDLLPILDNFDRAVSAKIEEEDKNIKAFLEGVVMIKDQLNGMLSRNYGLKYYKSKGELFDPNIHEAVAKTASKDVKQETVGEEIQKGYKLKDKVLRHAKVLVLMPESDSEEPEAK